MLKSILLSILTEKFVKELLLLALKQLAKKTDNKIDDQLVELVGEKLNENERA